jgi:hypothetical protein
MLRPPYSQRKLGRWTSRTVWTAAKISITWTRSPYRPARNQNTLCRPSHLCCKSIYFNITQKMFPRNESDLETKVILSRPSLYWSDVCTIIFVISQEEYPVKILLCPDVIFTLCAVQILLNLNCIVTFNGRKLNTDF